MEQQTKLMSLDLSQYIDAKGLFNLPAFLNENGYQDREKVLNLQIDTTALGALLEVCPGTLRNYVNMGLIKLNRRRRIALKDALTLMNVDFRHEIKKMQPFSANRRQVIR